MRMEIKLAYDDIDNIKELFTEYIKLLFDYDSGFQDILDLQDYEFEMGNPEKKYALPNGRLYIAYCDDRVAGCIALRKLSETECEMKRFYVRPQFRGNHIGRALAEAIIDDAKEIGYESMLLDTLPMLTTAIAMYDGMGFQRIPPYNDYPVEKTVFMKLDLRG